MSRLFTPLRVGRYVLSHRVVLAPMTRLRTLQPDDIPSPMMADFYGQRASKGGLEIVEGVSISMVARSYLGAAIETAEKQHARQRHRAGTTGEIT